MDSSLKEFFEAVAFAANSTTLAINFKALKFKFPGWAVKDALNNTVEIEKLLDNLFIRKQVMYEHPKFENIDWCINSLRDLREKCDDASTGFLRKGQKNDSNHFWATLLRTWGSYSDEAYKEIVKINLTGSSLDKILKDFRKKTYPIILTMISSLPDTSITQTNAQTKFDDGLRNTGLSFKSVLPTWSIEK